MSSRRIRHFGLFAVLSVTVLGLPALAQSGPPATPEIVAAAAAAKTPVAPGPFEPTWDSIREHYTVPQWFIDAKFGITMHWGLFSVAAYHNEWYERYMYTDVLAVAHRAFRPSGSVWLQGLHPDVQGD